MATGSTSAVVADDSHFMRRVISDILEAGNIDVVAEARNGVEAVEAVAEHAPDVVTMDVEMPEMNGIEAVERIMEAHPTPILMLSAHTEENAEVTFEALEKGAVDFFTKPGGEVSMEMSRLEDQLVEMVLTVAEVDVGEAASDAEPTAPERPPQPTYVERPTLIIGSSTGGPRMVERILTELPLEADFRVLIVQHMPKGFTGRFADRINAGSDYAVREAADGDAIGGGEALVAAGDSHLRVANATDRRLTVELTNAPPVNSVRPAVDVTMQTAAETIDGPIVGVILTGMGDDGARGIEAIGEGGGTCLVQDEETSAVFGMPQRAIETGHVDDILPITDIPDGILAAVRTDGE